MTPVPDVTASRGGPGSDQLSDVLDAFEAFLRRFLWLPSDEHYWVLVLWIGHCYFVDAFDTTPRLAVVSPEKGSGKTRLLELIEMITPNVVLTANCSAAALFRRIHSEKKVVLLIDEFDTVFEGRTQAGAEDIRALLNSGHRRGATVERCAGDRHTPMSFNCFCPVVLAGIGMPPDTILDRAVMFSMKKSLPGEVDRLRRRDVEDETDELVAAMTAMSEQLLQPAELIRPTLPKEISDRGLDVFEPLAVVGELAGHRWQERSLNVAVTFDRQRREESLPKGSLLLDDIWNLFENSDESFLSAVEIVSRIDANEDRKYPGKLKTPKKLANQLHPYGVESERIRIDGEQLRGYSRDDIKNAWTRSGAGAVTHPTGSGTPGTSGTDANPHNDQGML